MDERERVQKIRKIKLIIKEVLFFVSVICLVVFLTLLVAGYSFNLKKIGSEDGEVINRTGLVQISSTPIGAAINIDGGAPLLLRTNGSRAVEVGEHNILLKRDGYTDWEKSVVVKEGMMYRLNYPRLFLEEREAEKVFSLEGLSATFVPPNMGKMYFVQNGVMYVANLNSTKPVITSMEFEMDGKAIEKIGRLEGIEWSGNSERLIARLDGEMVVLNMKSGEVMSIDNLLKPEALKIKKLRVESESGDKLLILTESGEIREIDVKDGKVSEALMKKVDDFDNDEGRVVFASEGEIKAWRVGSEESYVIAEVAEGTKFATMRYYSEYTLGVASGEKVMIFSSEEWPGDDYGFEQIFEDNVDFSVKTIRKRGKGMVFGLIGEGAEAVYDVEAEGLKSVEPGKGWIDEFLRYDVGEDGSIVVRDYDGLNERKLVEKGASGEKIVVISGDNKWLYYFVGETLMRERII